jgi:16S rRNA processing protein RimM
MDKSAFQRVATVVKTHGIHGEIILKLHRKSLSLKSNEPVFLDIDGGLVPFFISSYEQTGTETGILGLQDVESDLMARRLKDIDLYVDTSVYDIRQPAEFGISDMVGYLIIDNTSGYRGEVIEFVDIPKNPLLKVRKGKKELLIPLREEMILGIDSKKKRIIIQAPEGLFSLDR